MGTRHGGDIYNNIIEYDFSVSTNPCKMPKEAVDAIIKQADYSSYPDIESTALRQKIATKIGISPDMIVAGNGASELFMAIFHALRPAKCIIPIPSFSGYKYASDAVGADIVPVKMAACGLTCNDLEECISSCNAGAGDLLIIANPNNPTGRYINHGELVGIIEECLHRDITVILDECFMRISDNPEDNSLISCDLYKNLIVVSAFTKSFAMAGIRLGYLVCHNSELLDRIKKNLPEWNLSRIAQLAGEAALDAADYLDKSRKLIADERAYLISNLKALGIDVCDTCTNFILFRINQDIELYKLLLKRKILIRDCSDFEGLGDSYYRIAVKTHEENKVLVEAIEQILKRDNNEKN